MDHIAETECRRKRLWITGAAAYVLFLAGFIGALLVARHRVLEPERRSAAQAHWEAWREEAAKEVRESQGSRRQVPISPEPPAVVLLRDYFGWCVAIVAVMGSALFASFWFFLHGSLTQARRTHGRPS